MFGFFNKIFNKSLCEPLESRKKLDNYLFNYIFNLIKKNDIKKVLEIGFGNKTFIEGLAFKVNEKREDNRVIFVGVEKKLPDSVNYGIENLNIYLHYSSDIINPNIINYLVNKYGKFDLIYSWFVFHLIEESFVLFENLNYLLNDKGYLLFTVNCSNLLCERRPVPCEDIILALKSYFRILEIKSFFFKDKPHKSCEREHYHLGIFVVAKKK
ncbi:MAG: class I SAM-dependent methyltransferase [Nanoarchaeota archaeon]